MFQINDNFQKLPGSYLFSTIAKKVNAYQQENPDSSLLIITHSTKILESLHVDYTHVMVNGHIIATGDASLIEQINREGYEQFKEQM